MLWAARQLLVPLNYLRIKHGRGIFHSKMTYDFVLPIIFSALTWLAFWFLDIPLRIFSNPDMTTRITDLLQLMIVFYMAALAAVATFERRGIDKPLKGGDAILHIRHHDGGGKRPKILSHREFICYLFGYLSFLSLVLFMFLTIFDVVWPKFEEHFAAQAAVHHFLIHMVDPIALFVFFVAVWQLIFTSLLGIYFLTDRLQVLSDPDA
jgi:hypothetical protein